MADPSRAEPPTSDTKSDTKSDTNMGPDGRLVAGLVLVTGVAVVVLLATLIPWGWRSGVAPVETDRYFTFDHVREARAFSTDQRALGWLSTAMALGTALMLAFTSVGRRIVEAINGPWWLRTVLVTLAAVAVGRLATLGPAYAGYRGAVLRGLSTQSFAGWMRDKAVAFGIDAVVTAVAMLLLVTLVRRATRRWPLYVAGLVAVFGVAGSFLYPVVIEPLFNDFTPMKASPLRTEILELAAREHVQIDDVLVADASRRTTTLNAYVSGFGSTRRVVVYDTLLRQLPPAEVRAVIAHELAHAHHDDVMVGTGIGALGGAFGVGLLAWLSRFEALRRPLRLRSLGEPGGVLVVLAALAVGSLLAAPVLNGASRAVEARADNDALAATGDPAAFIGLQVNLSLAALSDPSPPELNQFWFGSHPTTVQRIGLAETYADAH